MRTVHYELLRPGEILAAREQCPLAYVPVSPLEWHAPHLPIGTDALHAGAIAEQLALRTGGVVLPTFYWGTERERPLLAAAAYRLDQPGKEEGQSSFA
jgi:creatinine amidohydrolase